MPPCRTVAATPPGHLPRTCWIYRAIGREAPQDPFGNPVLLVALAISRRIDALAMSEADIAALIRHLRDAAFADRAHGSPLCRWHRYAAEHRGPGRTGAAPAAAGPERQPGALGRVSRPGGAHAFRRGVHRASDLRAARRGGARPGGDRQRAADRRPAGSHRPPPITLADEFAQAAAAIANGRDAIDRFNAALLSVARSAWPDRWTELDPRPVILSSWVGYDTDGRTDIGWWDTLRLRLEMKRLQLARLHAQVAALPATEALAARIAARAGRGRRAARASVRTRRTRRASPPSRRRWWAGARPR